MSKNVYDDMKIQYQDTIRALRARADQLRSELYSSDCVFNKKTRRRFFARIKSLESSALDMEYSLSIFSKYS